MRWAAVGGVGLAVAGLLLASAMFPAASAATTWHPDPLSWTNGVVLCEFAPASPAVNVSAFRLTGTGLTFALGGLSEDRANGSAVAVANLSGLAWTASNQSNEDAYDLAYVAVAPLASPSSAGAPVGSVDLRVDFVLPAYAGSELGDPSTVTVALSVSNWTWQGTGDHLSATFSVAPTFPGTEHLVAAAGSGWLLAGANSTTGNDLEWVGANAVASVRSTSGVPSNISAAASATVESPSAAAVHVVFGSEGGSFGSLAFDAQVGIVLPSTVVGIPLGDLVAVGAAAVLASLAIAAGTRRVRRQRSRLIYVDEGEP